VIDAEGGQLMSSLDPRTAFVAFVHGDLGDQPGECVGRIYYWYDPERRVPAVDDQDFRAQHPEIDDESWDILFYEAFNRGERAFTSHLVREHPELVDSPALSLGRLFGPTKPTTSLIGHDITTEEWDGDPETLRGREKELSGDSAQCDQTFASKHEAFTAGLALGRRTLLDAGDGWQSASY
jgi:hypothetical protein